MAEKDLKDTKQDQDLGQTKESQAEQAKSQDSAQSSEQSNEEVSAENVAASTPQPGNPYTVSADGRGRAYDPAVDGAPGKEAEAKQAVADSAE